MLGDVLGLAMALGAIRFARRPATAGKTYGFYRAEILAALINSVLLMVVSLWILFAAYQRFKTPDVDIEALPMLVVAAGGIVVTLVGVALCAPAPNRALTSEPRSWRSSATCSGQ